MPELPEVETTRRGIAGHVIGRRITGAVVRHARLRWPVPPRLAEHVSGQTVQAVERRAKYLLLRLPGGTLILHLGMSGSLRLLPAATPAGKHDHVDLVLDNGLCLRLNDPRRFGALLWTEDDPLSHPLLRNLGPEPLERGFNGAYLFEISRTRRVSVKQFLMDSRIVVGVGNIYASEALFRAGIDPRRPAHKLTQVQCMRLASAIKAVLRAAIRQGGTSLRDFVAADGRPGYFGIRLQVYARAGEPCRVCKTPVRALRQGQRATYYCPRCQK